MLDDHSEQGSDSTRPPSVQPKVCHLQNAVGPSHPDPDHITNSEPHHNGHPTTNPHNNIPTNSNPRSDTLISDEHKDDGTHGEGLGDENESRRDDVGDEGDNKDDTAGPHSDRTHHAQRRPPVHLQLWYAGCLCKSEERDADDLPPSTPRRGSGSNLQRLGWHCKIQVHNRSNPRAIIAPSAMDLTKTRYLGSQTERLSIGKGSILKGAGHDFEEPVQ
ncbi:hypothetical protein NMY22_g16922 [Coprinellus aureogranulatus]|nr:hypothetical protein NMY22_g16922 [Coprinellus aureogranulatus]